MLQKIRFVFFFWQKRPKTIVIGIIVHDDKNSNLTRLYSYDLLCEPVLSMRTV